MSTLSDVTLGIDNAARHRAVTVESLEAAQRERDEAKRARDASGYDPVGVTARVRLVILEQEARLEDAEARLTECQRVFNVADGQWRTLVGAARQARHEARLQQAAAALQPVVACLAEDRRDHDAVCATLGLPQGAGEHPVTVAAHLRAVLDTHLRRLHPPPPPPPSPVPAGMTRIRVLKPFWDHDRAYGLRQEVGNTYNMRNEFVREALEQQLVEVVEP